MKKEQLRMQMLAGIITESQYKQRLNENEFGSFAQSTAQKHKLRLLPDPMDAAQVSQMYGKAKGDFGSGFEGVMAYSPSSNVVVVLSKDEKTGEEVFNDFKKFNSDDTGYESFGITVGGYKFPINTPPKGDEEKAFVKPFKIKVN